MQARVVHVVSGNNDQGHQPNDVPDDNGPGDPGGNQATIEQPGADECLTDEEQLGETYAPQTGESELSEKQGHFGDGGAQCSYREQCYADHERRRSADSISDAGE